MLNRPYVTLNIAMTADGKTDTSDRKGAVISSQEDKVRVDRLRADHDAVMVGGKTLIGDNPRLTVKSDSLREDRIRKGLEENPVKVGIITNAILPIDSRFITEGNARKVIFTTKKTDPDQISRLREMGVYVLVGKGPQVDLKGALNELKSLGIGKLLVEGGGTLNEELIKLGLIDEIIAYIAPLLFGGATAPTFMSGTGLTRRNAIRLRNESTKMDAEGGILVRYTFKK